jgi:PAS domain S-box-containing protein
VAWAGRLVHRRSAGHRRGAAEACTQHEADLIYRFRRFDGEWRWILDRSVPRFRPDGTFAGLIGSCTDITDLRHAEDDLRVARDLAVRFAHASGLDDVLPACLAAALEVSDYTEGGIYLRDPDGALRVAQTLNVSPALRESLMYIAPGSERMAIVERGDPVFVDYARVPFAPNDVALAEGVTGLAMLPLHHQDEVVGLLLLASDRHGALAHARRGPLEAIAAQMSTALARRWSKALTRSERLVRTVVEHAPIAIWTLRPDGTVGDVWNPAAERLFGVTHADVVGRACPACLPAPGRDPALRAAGTSGTQPGDLLQRLFASSSIHDEQIQRQRPDGSLVEILPIRAPLLARWRRDRPSPSASTSPSASSSRRSRAETGEPRRAGWWPAHDFNNPLTGILGYTSARTDPRIPEHPVHELLGSPGSAPRDAVTRQMPRTRAAARSSSSTTRWRRVADLPLLSALWKHARHRARQTCRRSTGHRPGAAVVHQPRHQRCRGSA